VAHVEVDAFFRVDCPVEPDVKNSRSKQERVAANMICEYSELIARNSLLRFYVAPDGTTRLSLSVGISNPQPGEQFHGKP
jgi:hypothetical protein